MVVAIDVVGIVVVEVIVVVVVVAVVVLAEIVVAVVIVVVAVVIVVVVVDVAVVVVVDVVVVVVVPRYCSSSPGSVILPRGRLGGGDQGMCREDELAGNGSADRVVTEWCAAGVQNSLSLAVPRSPADVRRTAGTRAGRVGGMGRTCRRGLPRYSRSTSGGDWRCATPLIFPSSIGVRHPGRMVEAASAALFVPSVTVIVERVESGLRASGQQQRSSPQSSRTGRRAGVLPMTC